MSDDWINGNDRLIDQVGPDKADEISRALKNNEVDRVLSKIDKTEKVTTQKLDKFGKVIK
jgi:Mg/Co/Ni transporter MgtE